MNEPTPSSFGLILAKFQALSWKISVNKMEKMEKAINKVDFENF